MLRLSQAMTYKAAAADLNCGGGKSVLLGDQAKSRVKHILEPMVAILMF